MKLSVIILVIINLLSLQNIFGQNYSTQSETCYLAPSVTSLSTNTTCVGLVGDKKKINWTLPRKILFIDSDLIDQNLKIYSKKVTNNQSISTAIVTAMGGWQKNLGQVWKLNLQDGKLISSELLFKNTDRTHGLALGNNQWIYYADSTKIYRFKINNPIQTRELVITNLPDSYQDRNNQTSPSSHPLKEIIFLKNWDMIVNIGAPSNDCSEEFKTFRACHQRDQQAEVRKYKYNSYEDSYPGDYEVIARGLRNSMGLLYNPVAQEIYQAENAADNLGTPDELNVINPNLLASNQDFGWPFCFGNQNNYIGYNRFTNFCRNTSLAPEIILPAHAAPLDIKYYNGEMFKNLKNSILMSWHGHRPSGSKIAAFETDSNLTPKDKYSIRSRTPEAPVQLMSSRWEKAEPNGHPKGRPVGIGFDQAGAIFVIDDANHSLLVLVPKSKNTSDPEIIEPAEYTNLDLLKLYSEEQLLRWPETLGKITQLNCQSCHSDIFSKDSTETLLNMINNQWLNANSKTLEDQLIWVRMTGFNGSKVMPPAPAENIFSLDKENLTSIESWLQSE